VMTMVVVMGVVVMEVVAVLRRGNRLYCLSLNVSETSRNK